MTTTTRLLLLLLQLIVLVVVAYGETSTTFIWPKPSQVSSNGSLTPIIINHQKFVFDQGNVPSGEPQQLLLKSIERYKSFMFYNKEIPARSSSPLCNHNAYVCVDGIQFTFDPSPRQNSSIVNELTLDMDERYSISLNNNNNIISVHCYSVWGAMRALETISQLVIIENHQQQKKMSGEEAYYTLNMDAPFSIVDQPRFPWRGVMIDSSRHFLPIKKILKIVQAISFAKFNVLHWHIVDAQSFPFTVPGAPLLTKGAYSPKAIYTPQDIQHVVDTAKTYGIRVVVEFDVPGHAASWGIGYPEITAKCPKYEANINNIPLDPTNEKTYEVIEEIINTAVKVFPDQFMHFGGDELVQSCWKQDPRISKWMEQMGWTDYNRLLAYFETRLQAIYTKHQKTMIAWEELLLEHSDIYTLPAQSIVQAWRTKKALKQIITSGYRGLLSAGWYLDKQVPGNTTHYLWGDTWKDFYTNDPTSDLGFTPDMEARVLGGEACMWGEQVDAVSIEARMFPRVMGVAERLWSKAKDTQDVNEAQQRLSFTRCHVLVRRGVHAGPIRPDYCDATEEYY